MAITDKNTLKGWFRRGMTPLESQFAAWIDSYWHKSENIPTGSIDGLEETLNSKAESAALQAHQNDFNNPHRVGQTQVGLGNVDNTADRDKPVSVAQREALILHDESDTAHPDIRNAVTNIENGTTVAGNSEYAEKLGTPADSYTKMQLDARMDEFLTKTGDTRSNVTTFTEPSVRTNIASADPHTLLFGKIKKWFSDLKSLAFKDSVNLSAVPDASAVTIGNDCGNPAHLPAATSTTAGVMTATDRSKMVQLFDGSMLDSANQSGYHKHNYLEMADLPPTVELSAATYQEFKDAVAKLQGMSSLNRKFGRILVTGACIVDDDTEFDLTSIDVNCFAGGFVIVNKPLKICGAVKLTNLCLDSGLNTYSRGFEALKARISIWDNIEIGTLKISRCPYPDATPQITVSGNSASGNIYFTVNKLLGYSGNGSEHFPCIIKCNNTGTTVVKIGEIERMGIYNDFDSVRIVSNNLNNVRLAISKNVLIENIAEIPDVRLISGGLLDLRSCESSVPVPSVGVRTKYHFLNALGEWVDIRTLTGAQ